MLEQVVELGGERRHRATARGLVAEEIAPGIRGADESGHPCAEPLTGRSPPREAQAGVPGAGKHVEGVDATR